MLNRHEAHDELNATNRELPRDVAPHADRPLADREVPLPGLSAATGNADVIHQWLDGEAPEADARRADARQVEFWKRVDSDADRLRRMKTPAHVAANIMAALPPVAVETRAATATVAATTADVSTTVQNATSATKAPSGKTALVGALMLALGILIGKMLF